MRVSKEPKQLTYLEILQQQLKQAVDHNETVLAYIRLLNAQVSGNTHRITELQHQIAKEMGLKGE
jgi:hypothetical protein